MPNPVVHFEIQSNQAEELQKFYGDLFDWTIHVTPDIGYRVVHKEEGGIGGGIGGTMDGPNMVTFYTEVDDIQGYLDKAVELGAKVVAPVTEIPNMVTFALFSDPEGNVLGIVQAEEGGSDG